MAWHVRVAALAVLCVFGRANLRVSDSVVRYDLASSSWRIQLTDSALPVPWNMVIPLVCIHAECERQPVFETGFAPCTTVSTSVNSSRQFWLHARPGCTTCASRTSDWIHMRPPHLLYISADSARLRPYMRDGVLTVRVVRVQILEAPNTTCLVHSDDISLELPEYTPALVSLLVENACVAAGMVAPSESLLVRLEQPGVLVCVWQCHPALVRVPWNAAPAAAGAASALSCEAFPAEFTAAFVVAHLAVPSWWKAPELDQEIFDDIDAVSIQLALVLAPLLAHATVACAVQDSIYDFLSLRRNVQHHVAAAAHAGLAYEVIVNNQSVLAGLSSEPTGGALRLECRVTTSEVLRQPADLVALLRPKFRAAMADLQERQPETLLIHFDVARVVRFSKTGEDAMETVTAARSDTIEQYGRGMAFVETLCVLVALGLVASRAAVTWQQ